jgi:hypothetical protein|nr:MAG TPA: helix-turn-helix domain protein [Bacteriophage sp.]
MISQRIKELRLENELTQKELSDYLGLTPKMISFYELGQRVPPSDIILKLADKFQVSTDYLLGNDTPISPTGQKIDTRTRRQLEKVLEDDELTYNGVVLNAEDKEKVKKALELAFWNIKELNKRNK